MDSIIILLLNIAIAALLILASWKMTEYDFAWWLRVKRSESVMSKFYKKNVVLEIRLPQEVFKNPGAMEIVLNALNQGLGHKPNPITAEADKMIKEGKVGPISKYFSRAWRDKVREEFFLKYLSGSIRMWHSLEIHSIEGQIKFYVVTQDKNAEVFKAYAYSQYPGIEISEVPDPLLQYDYNKKKHPSGKPNIYVGRYIIDPKKDYMPIKTYVDYGLDRDPKEEYKIDPLTPLLEAMAAAGPGERFFFQMLIRPTTDSKWADQAKKRIDEILGISRYKEDDPEVKEKKKNVGDIKERKGSSVNITPQEKHELEILQKNIEKPGFDTIIRMFYHVDDPNIPTFLNRGVFTVVNAMKSWNKPGYATFDFKTVTVDGDTPFLDPTGGFSEGKRFYTWYLAKMRSGFYVETDLVEGKIWHALKEYKRRRFVGKNRDWAGDALGELKEYYEEVGTYKHRGHALDFILNLEELVTIYHFPGKAFGNTSGRVESIKSDPPRNLPI
jgi:hypothetical protein